MNDCSWLAKSVGISVSPGLAFLIVLTSACGTGNPGDGSPASSGGPSAMGSAGSPNQASGGTTGGMSGGSPAGGSAGAGVGGQLPSAGSSSGGAGGTSGASATSGAGGTSDAGGGSSSSGPYYVSPSGTGSACSSAAPCSITQAQAAVRAVVGAMQADVIVELSDGVYSLIAPLVFTSADSGSSGHQVIWRAATGSHPILSGGKRITGWAVSDSAKNIWKASAPADFATRQLYVDGKLAARARSSSISRADMTVTSGGWTFSSSSLNYLKNLSQPKRAELDIIGSWSNRYAPIQSVANNTVTMAQPAWDENTWGYDTVQSPYRQGPIYVENDYTLLDQPGEWYQDTTAGALYYIPLSGQDLSKADVELPQLELLLAVAGTYETPAHDLSFNGLTFAHTSWLRPNSSEGFADQQTGGYLAGPKSMYPTFEATRPQWQQMPAAVQISAAQKITLSRDRFQALGSVALGIGNDDNAHHSGVGLGASSISVSGCVFQQIAGGAIVIGGIQAKAHHPGGDVAPSALTATQLALVDQNITINDNLVHDVGIDYRDFAGIMFTYTQKVVVSHNEIYNVPYSAIATGYGWGTNDAGGNGEYKSRPTGNLYAYQPLYQNSTIAMNNSVTANSLHQMQLEMNDGGCHYNLSANPGTVVTQNYCEGKGSGLSGQIWGEYADEGSAYLTITKNVYANFGSYVTANANASNNTGHLTFTNNWGSSANPGVNGPANVVMGNVAISGDNFPSDAQAIVSAAGLEAAYADIKTNP